MEHSLRAILSFDVDRTLVDRRRSSHDVSQPIKRALIDAANSKAVRVILNTGRDLSALREFDLTIGKPLDALFLSGRATRLYGRIWMNPRAILPMSLLTVALEMVSVLEIPFLDIKTGDGVLYLKFRDTNVPFGFQKPIDWYGRSRPIVVEGSGVEAQDILEHSPMRLEIPLKAAMSNILASRLSAVAPCFLQEISPHRDFTTKGFNAQDWTILQVLSPVAETNKGTALATVLQDTTREVSIVHFGDSDVGHNSDAVVLQQLPTSRFVRVRWGECDDRELEELIVKTIREYL